MKKHVAVSVLLSAALLLLCTLSALTHSTKGAAAAKHGSSPTASRPVVKAALSALSAKQKAANVQAPEAAPGQTVTLLPDGRWLLVGGEGESGPLASVVVKDVRA